MALALPGCNSSETLLTVNVCVTTSDCAGVQTAVEGELTAVLRYTNVIGESDQTTITSAFSLTDDGQRLCRQVELPRSFDFSGIDYDNSDGMKVQSLATQYATDRCEPGWQYTTLADGGRLCLGSTRYDSRDWWNLCDENVRNFADDELVAEAYENRHEGRWTGYTCLYQRFAQPRPKAVTSTLDSFQVDGEVADLDVSVSCGT